MALTYQVIYGCKSCRTHMYTLPMPINKSIQDFLGILGKFEFDLNRYSIVKIDNASLAVQSRIGSTELHVKFKDKDDERIVELFNVQLEAYVDTLLNFPVSMERK